LVKKCNNTRQQQERNIRETNKQGEEKQTTRRTEFGWTWIIGTMASKTCAGTANGA
jgi:hypothetical protein